MMKASVTQDKTNKMLEARKEAEEEAAEWATAAEAKTIKVCQARKRAEDAAAAWAKASAHEFKLKARQKKKADDAAAEWVTAAKDALKARKKAEDAAIKVVRCSHADANDEHTPVKFGRAPSEAMPCQPVTEKAQGKRPVAAGAFVVGSFVWCIPLNDGKRWFVGKVVATTEGKRGVYKVRLTTEAGGLYSVPKSEAKDRMKHA